MAEPEGRADARRSRLSAAREAEIRNAVLDLLCEVGYDRLSLDAVATRARAGKATLYRRWGGRAALVADAVCGHAYFDADLVDTGTLRGDLHAVAHVIGEAGVKDAAVLKALIGGLQSDVELDVALRESDSRLRLGAVAKVVRRAVERGEVDPGCPALAFLPSLIGGALLVCPFSGGAGASATRMSEYMDACVLPALAPGAVFR